MPSIPLLSGSRVLVLDVPEDAVVIRPPPPAEGIADIGAAVRDALRFPLAGEPLPGLTPPGGRAAIVIEPPELPLPGVPDDPREAAIAAAVEELSAAGIPSERQTIVVAGGLSRRAGREELESYVSPAFARRFRGRVVVHDAEDPGLITLGELGRAPLAVNQALVDADVVVVVSAAETALHGGPAALLGASGATTLRAAGALSLLETSTSSGWRLGVALERALMQRVPVIGVSLALTTPAPVGALRGYPHDPEVVERVARFPLRRLFGVLPGGVRLRLLRRLPVRLEAVGVFAGPPSVAHAEALLRGLELRSAELAEPLDALCIGIPHATPHLPRERPNPLLAAHLGLGLALGLWRDSFPLVDGGTVILLHRFHRRFSHPTQAPYRGFFSAIVRLGREPEALLEAEDAASTDERAVAAYREGRSCHPALPYVDWRACQPALRRAGAVLVAGCRDATAARQLGFVPTQGLNAALAMAHGRAGGPPRVGYLLAPPYYPIRTGNGSED